MIPLEMKHMVRVCRPKIPSVGLHRMSADLEKTLEYERQARQKRNVECLPYLLRQMTEHCTRHRLRRRLWIAALDPLCHDLIEQVLHYLPVLPRSSSDSSDPDPPSCFRFWSARYDTLSVPVRMSQVAGMLHALGYTQMILPEPDYEYEAYRLLLDKSNTYYVYRIDIDPLYQSLKEAQVVDKWADISSYIYKSTRRLEWCKEEWQMYCEREQLTLYLNACIRINNLSPIEIQLVTEWVHRMKHPSLIW